MKDPLQQAKECIETSRKAVTPQDRYSWAMLAVAYNLYAAAEGLLRVTTAWTDRDGYDKHGIDVTGHITNHY